MKQKKYSKQSRLRIFLNQCQTPHIVETQKYQARQTPKELYLGISYHVQTSKIKHLKKILERKNLERSQRRKKHLTNRGAKIRIKSNLSSETMQ